MPRKPKKKSVEQRLFEAYRAHRGVRLSADELDAMLFDDAIEARICNQAAIDAGNKEPGCAALEMQHGLTWKQLGESFSD